MRRLPSILVLVHSAVVLLVAGGVYASLASGKQEAVQLWAVPAFIDLPVAWLIAGLEAMLIAGLEAMLIAGLEAMLKARLDGAGEMVRWVWFPEGGFLVAGGLWWWLVGVVIGRLIARWKAGASGE